MQDDDEDKSMDGGLNATKKALIQSKSSFLETEKMDSSKLNLI